MPRELETQLDSDYAELLREEAAKEGIDPKVLAGRIIRKRLELRTRPGKTRGTVTPFRAKT